MIDIANPIHLAAAVIGIGQLGMLSHYIKKWLRKEIEGNLIDYLFRDHARESALAEFTFIGAALTAVLSGQFDGLTLNQIAMPAFLIGYAIDSAINKGASAQA